MRPRPARPSRRPPGRPRTVAPALRVRPCLTRRGAGARALWQAACALGAAALQHCSTGCGDGDGHRARRQSGRWPQAQRPLPTTHPPAATVPESPGPHSDTELPRPAGRVTGALAVSSRWRSVTVGLTLPVSVTVTVRPQVSSYLLWTGSPARPDRRPAYCGHCCGGRADD